MEELVTQLIGYLRGMWRFRWWGLALSWLVGVVGCAMVYLMPDKYESSARIFVDTQSVLRPLMSGLAVQPNIDQQVAILSRTLISRPNVEKLITMADLDLGVRSQKEREALIDSLSNSLQIRSADRNSNNLFLLAYADTQPARAQRVVQSLVSLFVESGLGSKRQDSDAARRFIEEQIKSYEQKLMEAENRLKEFRLKNMALLGSSAGDFVSQIGKLQEQLEQARLELREAENSRDAMKQQLLGEPSSQEMAPPVAMATPEIDARIDALKRNLDDMMQRYTEQHPDVAGARRVIAQLEEQKKEQVAQLQQSATSAPMSIMSANPAFQQLKLALAEADARVASMRARVGEYESRIQQLSNSARMVPELEAEMTQLNRDYAVHKSNYDALVARRESANIGVEMSAQAGIAEFRLIDPPTLPTKASAPNRLLLLPLVGLAALVAGAALTFLISQLRPAFSDGRALREATGLPVLGTVSMLSTPERIRARRRGLLVFSGGLASFVGAVAMATVALMVIQR
ncbi:XrtA system polysaccharide chain length determinant [Thauera sinica]|uniref:XrtA system polysaccharide chain length determinant n=1 Tax=Thauera sinica TaxID=2665146 RepID=A0ABW1AY83_9RHOO|nr:XrtA system polysaccharide chain length determinant [Thauera sp. K11]ATE60946.1 chain length-determining protein [Thauera sp. K11]